MASKVIQGRLTHVQQTTETHGQITRGTGQITSANAWSFRIANQAVLFKSRDGASLSDGDLVVAAGQDSKWIVPRTPWGHPRVCCVSSWAAFLRYSECP